MSTEGRHRVRASDSEREQYVTILRAAITEGRLTLEEGEERIARVYAATYRDELPPTTDDLPHGGRRALHDAPEAQADMRRAARRFLAGRLGVVVVVAATVLMLGAVAHGHIFWPFFPLLLLFVALRRRARFHRWAAGMQGYGQWRGPFGGAPWGWGGPGAGGPPWAQGEGGPGAGGPPWARGRRGGAPDDEEGWGR